MTPRTPLTAPTLPASLASLGRTVRGVLTLLTLGSACIGVLAGIGALIDVPALATPALALFVLLGPGAALLLWVEKLPVSATTVLVPAAGIAITVLLTTLAVSVSWWSPIALLVLLVVATAASGLLRLRLDRGRGAHRDEGGADGARISDLTENTA